MKVKCRLRQDVYNGTPTNQHHKTINNKVESSVFLVDGNDFAEKNWNYWRISLIIQVPVQQTDNALPRPLSSELEQYIAGLLNEKLISNLYHECPTNISTPITSGSTMQKKRLYIKTILTTPFKHASIYYPVMLDSGEQFVFNSFTNLLLNICNHV